MTLQFDADSDEGRLLSVLLKKYPVTVEELKRLLRMPEGRLERVLKGLVLKGVVVLEPLPGKTYVRLKRLDIQLIGLKESQRKPIKRAKRRKKDSEKLLKELREEDPAYR
ncbi:MAG: transcriptional regulator [Thermoplasmata archaeon]|nr:MAG: transcriptional regulator [Thermoplasmata archaeon]